MPGFSRGTLALLLSLTLCPALGAQVRAPSLLDTARVQRPTLARPPLVQVPDSIVVPEVTGQAVAIAVRRLIAAGLRPVTVDSMRVAEPTPGVVVSQAPKGADFDFLLGGPGEDLEPYLPL